MLVRRPAPPGIRHFFGKRSQYRGVPKRIGQYKESFGLAVVSDGATVNRTALINILAVVMSIALSESALGEKLRLFCNSAFRNYERNATSP